MLVFPDNVKFVTSTTGTGTLAVGSTVAGCRGMDAVTDGDQVIYRITSGTDWEIGIGTWDSGSETLTRTVRRSSNSDAALNLPAGDKEVFAGVSQDELRVLSLVGVSSTLGVEYFTTLTSLVPDATNTRDLGLATRKFRNLWLSGTVDAIGDIRTSGTVTANGGYATTSNHYTTFFGDFVTTLGSFSTTSGNFTTTEGTISAQSVVATESLTIRAKEAGPLMPGYTGLRITRESTTEISIAKGAIHNNLLTRRIDVDTAITLDLTEGGDFVNSSSRATNTWYHVLVGLIGDTVVAGLSTTLAKPAAWDSWQMIGAVETNGTGSGEWETFEQVRDRFHNIGFKTIYDNTSPGGSVNIIRAKCPPMACITQVVYRVRNPSSSTTVRIQDSSGNTIATGLSLVTGAERLFYPKYILTDASGQFGLQTSNVVTFSDLILYSDSFDYPIGEAASYE